MHVSHRQVHYATSAYEGRSGDSTWCTTSWSTVGMCRRLSTIRPGCVSMLIANIVDRLTTHMYTDWQSIDLGQAWQWIWQVYNLRTCVVHGHHLVMVLSAACMYTYAAQQCERLVLAHTQAEPMPMVSYVKVCMVMCVLIMGYKLIRSTVAQGRTTVVSNHRLATVTNAQTYEIMYSGDRLVWQGVGLCSRR